MLDKFAEGGDFGEAIGFNSRIGVGQSEGRKFGSSVEYCCECVERRLAEREEVRGKVRDEADAVAQRFVDC